MPISSVARQPCQFRVHRRREHGTGHGCFVEVDATLEPAGVGHRRDAEPHIPCEHCDRQIETMGAPARRSRSDGPGTLVMKPATRCCRRAKWSMMRAPRGPRMNSIVHRHPERSHPHPQRCEVGVDEGNPAAWATVAEQQGGSDRAASDCAQDATKAEGQLAEASQRMRSAVCRDWIRSTIPTWPWLAPGTTRSSHGGRSRANGTVMSSPHFRSRPAMPSTGSMSRMC